MNTKTLSFLFQMRVNKMQKTHWRNGIIFLDLLNDDVYLGKVVKIGRDKAHESAARTIKEVREIIGFKSF